MIYLNDIIKLSVPERLALLQKIWESIDEEDIKITPAQKKELDRRLKKMEAGESKFYSWTEIRKSLKSL